MACARLRGHLALVLRLLLLPEALLHRQGDHGDEARLGRRAARLPRGGLPGGLRPGAVRRQLRRRSAGAADHAARGHGRHHRRQRPLRVHEPARPVHGADDRQRPGPGHGLVGQRRVDGGVVHAAAARHRHGLLGHQLPGGRGGRQRPGGLGARGVRLSVRLLHRLAGAAGRLGLLPLQPAQPARGRGPACPRRPRRGARGRRRAGAGAVAARSSSTSRWSAPSTSS